MKQFALLFFCTCLSFISTAQKHEDALHLKDGTVFSGRIVEWFPGEKITIETNGENKTFNIQDIYKISRSPQDLSKGLPPGLIGIVDIGYGKGIQSYVPNMLKINLLAGYRVSPHVSFGLGSGFRGYVGQNLSSSYRYVTDHPFIPILGDMRFTILNNRQSPFFSITGGYAIQTASNQTKAWIINPAFGTIVRVSSGSAMKVSLGYDITLFKSVAGPWNTQNITHQCIVFQLGFVF